MSDVIAKDKQIAKMVAGIFNGKNSVHRYRDRDEQNHIDILSSLNSPEEGITSYSTIGLSSYPLIKDDKEYPTRVEFVGTASNDFSLFANALATAAFNISVSRFFCYPGAIFTDVLSVHKVSKTMCSFLLTPPFLWEGSLETIVIDGLSIAWLMAIPISISEERYAAEYGSDALEDILEEKEIDIFDLNRPSVV